MVDRGGLAAKERARKPHRLGRRDRRQVDAVGDVADRMDRVDARLRVAIDDHRPVGGQLHADALEAEVRGVRLAAGGEEHELGPLVRAVAVAHLEAVGVLDDVRRLAAEVDLQALVRHLLGDALAEIGVEAAQQALAAVGKRGLDAEPVEDGSELERDVAAADD